MPANSAMLVIEYARMWPREVFDIITKDGKLAIGGKDMIDILKKSGVYILYEQERPHYIGQAKVLFRRLHDHANKSTDKFFNLWNYFSAFVVDPEHIDEVEGILIAAMPTTANSTAPKIKQITVPPKLRTILRKARQGGFTLRADL